MNRIFKHLKIYLLENDVVRFEYCPNDNFTIKETLFVASKKEIDEEIEFQTDENVSFVYKGLTFTFNENDPLSSLVVTKKNNVVYKYQDIKNSGELPLPNKTPIIFPLMDSPRLILSSEGYVKNNTGFKVEENVKDLYLLIANNDYLKLRKQFISLTGRNELPRLKTLGLFSSRYFKYNQKTAIKMIQTYERFRIPLDTFILDTDWRDSEIQAGCGYAVNEKLFPDMKKFYDYAHAHNIQIMMNDHPMPLTETSTVFDNEEIDYRHSNLTKFYNIGLDGWWYDRNWTCKLNSVNKFIASETLGNYIYHDITKQFYLGFTLDPEVYERSLVLSNIINIKNGIYDKIVDSRSHRYALQWSGDTWSDEQSLRNEIVNLNKCANNMIAFYSSDLGGHQGTPSKKQYIRWIQYGAFSPIFRPHCTATVKKFREPWNYDRQTIDIFRTYINMRYRLLNVFYTAAFKNVDNGLGVCSPLYLHYPTDKKVYKEETSYMLGNSILVSPITNVGKPVPLTHWDFGNRLRLTIYPNNEFKGPISFTKSVKSFTDINKFYNEVKAKFPKEKEFSFRYKGELKIKNDCKLAIRNDLPAKVTIDGVEVFNDLNCHYNTFTEFSTLGKNASQKVVVEVVQKRKAKDIEILGYKMFKNEKTKIYLPNGEWYNIFHRNVYQGNRYIAEKFKIHETPVFVKAGALIPLYKSVDNISKMSLKTIVYEYFTSKKEKVNDFFYEDDGKTMAYRIGEYRKNEYKTYYKNDRYVVELKGSEKLLDDGIKSRDVFFKVHVRDNETIDKVLINKEPIKFKRHDHAFFAVPFLDDKFAKDSKSLTFKFKQNIKDDYKIEFIIRQK